MQRTTLSPDSSYGDLPEHLRQGELNPGLQKGLKVGLIAALIAALGVAAFTLISFIGAPFILAVFINAWFAGSMIYLAGLAYGIVNDLIGCRKNLPYFSLGHQPGQKGVIRSNDPNAVGIAWGILATGPLAIIAAVLFTVTTLIAGFAGAPFVAFALPFIALAIPLVLLGAHLFSRKKEKEYQEQGLEITYGDGTKARRKDLKFLVTKGFTDDYQSPRLEHWLKDDKAASTWLSNSSRNMVGFIALPLVGVAGLVSLITLSSIPSLLPAALFTASFAVFPPVALGLLLVVGIAAACAYLYINRNKKVNNGYRLDYPGDTPDPAPASEKQPDSPRAKLESRPGSPSTRLQVEATLAAAGGGNKNSQTKVPVAVVPALVSLSAAQADRNPTRGVQQFQSRPESTPDDREDPLTRQHEKTAGLEARR